MEQKIIEIIQDYQLKHKKAPSYQTIADQLKVSKQYIHKVIRRMIKDGQLTDKIHLVLD